MKRIVIFGIGFIFLFLLIPRAVNGASLTFSPSSGNFSVGQTFAVRVLVDSGGEPGINAAEATINFDRNFLTVLSISRDNSIFNLWTVEPKFSNAAGSIEFGGGNPSPYKGSSGLVFTINFKAQKSGSASLSFSKASVLAADGFGTNVLTNSGTASFTISASIASPSPPPKEGEKEETANLPPRPAISSRSHPNQNQWYANNSPEFSWQIPSGVTDVSFAINEIPDADPGAISAGILSEQKYTAMQDGTWYFHLKFKNQYGWGRIAHRKVLIDATPPEEFQMELLRAQSKEGGALIALKARDKTSGIVAYEISVDAGESVRIEAKDLKENAYELVKLSSGSHSVSAKAFDAAGNFKEARLEINVEGIPPPQITVLSRNLTIYQPFFIAGISQPSSTVFISLRTTSQKGFSLEESVKADEGGRWFFARNDGLPAGEYELTLKEINVEGLESKPGEKLDVKVSAPSFFEKYGLWLTIIFLILIAAAIWLIIRERKYHYSEIKRLEKDLADKIKETASIASDVFAALSQKSEEEIKMADRRPAISIAEKVAIGKLDEAFRVSEEIMREALKKVLEIEWLGKKKK